MTDELHPFLARLAAAGAYEPPSRPYAARNGTGRVTALPGRGDPQATRYASTALEREARLVADTAPGTRNDTLNTASFRIGQLVALGWLDEHAATDALTDAGCESGLSWAESERTVLSGLDAGMRAPRLGVELLSLPATPPAYVLSPGAEPPADTGGVALGGGQVSDQSHGVEPDAATGELTTQDSPRPRQLIDGGAFIHGAAVDIPALWGHGDDVLWAEGEPLIITGPTGVGKTTLGTCAVAGRLGLTPGVLGYPVTPGLRRTLVLAMDRPRQIQRAMARLLRQFPEDVLNERLIVWQGPPPADLGRHPHMLYQLAELADADTVVIDSLKDAAIKLSDEETGQGLSRAMNYCVSNGVEVLAYHHQTKRSGNAQGKPNTLADVYGSSWITAGAGSVLLVWGNAGDLVVELSHLKQPADVVGPLSIGFDHGAGRAFLYDGMSEEDKLLDLLDSGPQTASTVASWLHDSADRAAVARMRRRLDRLVESGQAVLLDGPAPGRRDPSGRIEGREAARYALAVPRSDRSTPPKHTEARLPLEIDVSPGHTEEHPLDPVDLDNRRRITEAHRSTDSANPQVAPKTHRSTPTITATEARPRPPLKGGRGAGGARARVREGDSSSWNRNEVEVCARCHQESPPFVQVESGRRWCLRCADSPTENPMRFDREDD